MYLGLSDRTQQFIRGAILLAAYLIMGRLGVLFGAKSGYGSLVWPPSGISLAMLLLFGRSLWPAVFLGGFLTNLSFGMPFWASVAIGSGNVVEVLTSAYLLELVGFDKALRRLKDVLWFIVLGALLSTTISAFVGVVAMWLGGVMPFPYFEISLRAWWIGDALGDIVFTPLLLSLAVMKLPRMSWQRTLETAALAVGVTAVSLMIFFGVWKFSNGFLFQHLYILFPLLIWSALRLGMGGVNLMTLLISCVAIVSSAKGFGKFESATIQSQLLQLQFFIGVFGLTGMTLAAVISEREQAQAEAKEAIQARDDILAFVSHDLRNPLTAVRMNADLIERKSSGESAFRIANHVQNIQRLVGRMDQLIGDLLEFVKIEAGVLKIEPKSEDLNSVLRESYEMLKPIAAQKSQELIAEFQPESCVLHCDQRRILQVFSNLVGNAIKFTPKDGKIVITSKPTDQELEFSVQDTGPGISPEELPHIFDRYWQAKRNRHAGAGLGLSIARGIIEAHGGRLWVESSPAHGSTFHFTLPRFVDAN